MVRICKPSVLLGSITVITPGIAQSDFEPRLRSWIGQQPMWPQELTASLVAQSLRLVYVPYLAFDASGTAYWSGSMQVNGTVEDVCTSCMGVGYQSDGSVCTSCSGRGRTERTETKTERKSGFVKIETDGGYILDTDQPIKIDKSVNVLEGDSSQVVQKSDLNIDVVQPLSTTDSDMASALNRQLTAMLNEEATNQAGSDVVDLVLHGVDLQVRRSWYVLRPVYLGYVNFESRDMQFTLDGVTGRVNGDRPWHVTILSWMINLAIAFAIIAVVLSLAYVIFAVVLPAISH